VRGERREARGGGEWRETRGDKKKRGIRRDAPATKEIIKLMSAAYSPIHRIVTIKITKEKTSSFQVIIGSVLLLPKRPSSSSRSVSQGS